MRVVEGLALTPADERKKRDMPATQAPAKPAAKGQGPAPIAFRTGTASHDEMSYDESRALGAGTVDLPVLSIPPAGFLRHLWMIVDVTTSGNSANTAFKEDGIFNVIDTLQLEDVQSAPIFGPFAGWEVKTINKYGGYDHSSDPTASPAYSRTTGTGATGGSGTFAVRIPVELVDRDALGALPNKSGTAMFKLRVRLAPISAVYSTAPTNAPTVRVRFVQVAWWDPDQADLRGQSIAQQPPAMGTTQFWTKTPYDVPAGAFRKQMERVGYAIRNLIFVLRDANGSRAQGEADFPDPLNIQLDANVLASKVSRLWLHEMAVDYGYYGTAEAVNGPDNGVRVLQFCRDFGLKPGAETRRGYLETTSATRLEPNGSIGGSGTHVLTVITNDVAPMGSYSQITG